MTTTPEAIAVVQQAADDSVARRRVAIAVMATLAFLVVVNLAVLSFFAALLWSDHQDRKADARAGATIVRDLYDSINRTDRNLAKLTGQPETPPVTPPPRVAPTTTTRSSAAAMTIRPATTSTRPSQPPTSSTTATTVPKPPAASTTTTSTPGRQTTTTSTTACLLAVNGHCVP